MPRLAEHLTAESSSESQLRILLSSLQEQSQSPSQTQSPKTADSTNSPIEQRTSDSLARLVVWTCISRDLVFLLLVALAAFAYSSVLSEAAQKSIQLFITRAVKSIALQTLYLGD